MALPPDEYVTSSVYLPYDSVLPQFFLDHVLSPLGCLSSAGCTLPRLRYPTTMGSITRSGCFFAFKKFVPRRLFQYQQYLKSFPIAATTFDVNGSALVDTSTPLRQQPKTLAHKPPFIHARVPRVARCARVRRVGQNKGDLLPALPCRLERVLPPPALKTISPCFPWNLIIL